MAPKLPLGKIKDVALDTVNHPVETARGTVARGLTVAEALTRTAATKAAEGVAAVTGLVSSASQRTSAEGSRDLRPVPPVNEAGHPPVAEPAKSSGKRQGDPTAAATKPAAKKATAKKTTARKTATKKAAANKRPAQKAAAKTPAAKTTTAGRTTPKMTAPGDVTPSDDAEQAQQSTGQPTGQPLIDPSAAKAVRSESQTLRRAADPDKG